MWIGAVRLYQKAEALFRSPPLIYTFHGHYMFANLELDRQRRFFAPQTERNTEDWDEFLRALSVFLFISGKKWFLAKIVWSQTAFCARPGLAA